MHFVGLLWNLYKFCLLLGCGNGTSCYRLLGSKTNVIFAENDVCMEIN